MYKIVDGIKVKMTPEEEEEYHRMEEEAPAPEVSLSLDERVTVLERDMADIQTAYQEGVNHA